MTKLRVLDRFFHLWIIYVYGRWIITQYLTQIKENGKLNNGGFLSQEQHGGQPRAGLAGPIYVVLFTYIIYNRD